MEAEETESKPIETPIDEIEAKLVSLMQNHPDATPIVVGEILGALRANGLLPPNEEKELIRKALEKWGQ